MKVLITGATGFVGGAVARKLLADGDTVTALTRGGHERTLPLEKAGATIVVGSVGDPNGIAEAARGCDVIVHAAAVVGDHASRRALRWVNVAGTENVINAAKRAGVERMVHLSCADVTLWNGDRIHWNENRAGSLPAGEHARTKLLAEELAISASDDDLEIVVIRPAWVWGPGDTTTLPRLCREARLHGLQLIGSGKNLFSSLYIDNLAVAVQRALTAENTAGRAYYVTDHDTLSAREFFGQMCNAVGVASPKSGLALSIAYPKARLFRSGPNALSPAEVLRRGTNTLFDIQKAMTDLSYDPPVTVPEGMAALATWVSGAGGPAAVETLGRPPTGDGSVDEQVALAGGD